MEKYENPVLIGISLQAKTSQINNSSANHSIWFFGHIESNYFSSEEHSMSVCLVFQLRLCCHLSISYTLHVLSYNNMRTAGQGFMSCHHKCVIYICITNVYCICDMTSSTSLAWAIEGTMECEKFSSVLVYQILQRLGDYRLPSASD